jgi:hypothetical protein
MRPALGGCGQPAGHEEGAGPPDGEAQGVMPAPGWLERLGRVPGSRDMDHAPRRQVDDEESVDLPEEEVVGLDEVARPPSGRRGFASNRSAATRGAGVVR